MSKCAKSREFGAGTRRTGKPHDAKTSCIAKGHYQHSEGQRPSNPDVTSTFGQRPYSPRRSRCVPEYGRWPGDSLDFHSRGAMPFAMLTEAFGQKRPLRSAEFASRNQSGRAQALRLRIPRVTTGRLAPYRCGAMLMIDSSMYPAPGEQAKPYNSKRSCMAKGHNQHSEGQRPSNAGVTSTFGQRPYSTRRSSCVPEYGRWPNESLVFHFRGAVPFAVLTAVI